MKIAVVGHCGSGKTTIVQRLRALGHDAYVVGQEHSEIQHLWNRAEPEVVVHLDVSLATVRERRGKHWPEWLFERQGERLRSAIEAADVHVDTGEWSVDHTVQEILRHVAPD